MAMTTTAATMKPQPTESTTAVRPERGCRSNHNYAGRCNRDGNREQPCTREHDSNATGRHSISG
jgi:hypothetical protein